jgi:NPCBM/NEW2 domain
MACVESACAGKCPRHQQVGWRYRCVHPPFLPAPEDQLRDEPDVPRRTLLAGGNEGWDGYVGGPLTIGGVRYERGLGVHAPSEVEFHAGGRCTTVRAEVGLDDEAEGGSVIFQIWADGELAARTGIVTGTGAAVPLRADVSGAAVVRLVVTNGGDNAYFDHADWAAATITCGQPA